MSLFVFCSLLPWGLFHSRYVLLLCLFVVLLAAAPPGGQDDDATTAGFVLFGRWFHFLRLLCVVPYLSNKFSSFV